VAGGNFSSTALSSEVPVAVPALDPAELEQPGSERSPERARDVELAL
jgi:hypothetical protein